MMDINQDIFSINWNNHQSNEIVRIKVYKSILNNEITLDFIEKYIWKCFEYESCFGDPLKINYLYRQYLIDIFEDDIDIVFNNLILLNKLDVSKAKILISCLICAYERYLLSYHHIKNNVEKKDFVINANHYFCYIKNFINDNIDHNFSANFCHIVSCTNNLFMQMSEFEIIVSNTINLYLLLVISYNRSNDIEGEKLEILHNGKRVYEISKRIN